MNIGVRRTIVPWICDFLNNRQQCVKYNDTLSEYVFINGGVPQGTKLGPLSFQILINDAASDANTEFWKYVDDLTFAENRNPKVKGNLQTDLKNFEDWSETNCLKLNPSKCQALQINFGKTEPPFSDLKIGSESLAYVEKAKVLGMWLQNDLKWDTQVSNMLVKANRRLFMLRSLKKFGFDKDELLVVYKSYLRPVLEYVAPIWHSGITSKQSYEIERIQKGLAKPFSAIVTPCMKMPCLIVSWSHLMIEEQLNVSNLLLAWLTTSEQVISYPPPDLKFMVNDYVMQTHFPD